MGEVRIEPLKAGMISAAARTLAQAFITNPLHIAAFGPDQLDKNEAFFREGLARMKGTKLAAMEGERILGVIHWVRFPACQFSGIEKVAMVPAMLRAFGPRASGRVGRWLLVWSRHDPKQAHVHLGPIGVLPEAQGRRIGHRMMEIYCQELDRGSEAGYLETDRPENVGFYERFGFKVTGEAPVLGVINYFMTREGAR